MTTHDDDPTGSSSDSHPTTTTLILDEQKVIDQVGVVAQVQQEEEDAPEYSSTKDHNGGPAESIRGPSISTATDENAESEAGSIQNMPVVQVSDSPTSLAHDTSSPMPSPAPSLLSNRPPPSPARSQTVQEPANAALAHPQRRARNRTTEGRSANRLSGFFSNLIHRRDTMMMTGSRDPSHDGAAAPTPPRTESAPVSEAASRAVTPPPPAPPPRPVTPPPPLPPPTLTELGLSLSTLTSDLSPSHFTSPPSSGAFLPPHYLLLCHAQGLDVLPLVSPPIPQPYALVRRVNFKSVVVMEQRGVLVAIAGRRDGVRVYALDEIRKAIEWRLDVEVRRERDRQRRENSKKSSTSRSVETVDFKDRSGKTVKPSLSTPPPGEGPVRMRGNLLRKGSHNSIPVPASPPPVPLIPRSPFARTPRKSSMPPAVTAQQPPVPPIPDQPPPYARTEAPLRSQPSAISLRARSRSISVSNVLSGVTRQPSSSREADGKADWTAESSDDEAIDIVAAGASGSQALDERTSATLSANRTSSGLDQVVASTVTPPGHNRARSSVSRRNRPSDLDLTLAMPNPSTPLPPQQPSPAPTLVTLRQALMQTSPDPPGTGPDAAADDEEEDEADGRISLAQALMESRIPELPPPGSARPQEPILLSSADGRNSTASPPPTESGRTSRQSRASEYPPSAASSRRRRRRWSLLLTGPLEEDLEPPTSAPPSERTPHRFTRSHSFRSNRSQPAPPTPDVVPPTPNTPSSPPAGTDQPAPPQSSRSGRFTRIFSNAFHGRRSEERLTLAGHASDSETVKPAPNVQIHAPPPKLEYVKLPGTKNALMIKAVETAKKSFLAILCGDAGEKVELFAGTYRTALGLSRTFILPDSPRSLELQLQGDDLVEVFLVFSQNVFGLEPATVRVREVRIGRAERRAARRRARGNRSGESTTGQQDADPEDETNVSVTVGVAVAPNPDTLAAEESSERAPSPTLVAAEHPSAQPERPATPVETAASTTTPAEELLAVAPPTAGPYTTFQQLHFAPKFPLASIADDYIIPPTYPSFLEYRAEHEAETDENAVPEPTPAGFSPPGLPVPTPTAPPQWYYRDPKGVVHGPWKSSLMQAWYKQGLLPPDLPVRRAEDEEFILLKELRLQSVDPIQPFSFPPAEAPPPPIEVEKPLLLPISLLAQPRHFGPPALFFSSRGGHSTSIVDSRGRSVLKGKFVWTDDNSEDSAKAITKMGDIKRLEAFDVQDKSVLVAMRQGGLEVVDLRDALLKPADESRTILPHYMAPSGEINRRPPFVWRIGTPISITSSSTPFGALSQKSKGGFGGHLSTRKASVSTGKATGGNKADAGGHDPTDPEPVDGVFFMGRNDDEIYFCEKNAGSFRILRLAPQ